MNESQLEEYLMGQLSQYSKKIIANVLFELAPKKLGGLICTLAGITETNASQLKKEQRRKVIQLLKKLPVPIVATKPIDEAIVTNGGVSTAGIDPTTMQSKVCPAYSLRARQSTLTAPAADIIFKLHGQRALWRANRL